MFLKTTARNRSRNHFSLSKFQQPFHDHNVLAKYKRIFKGEFRCPEWFPRQLTHLLRRLLDTNPETRMKIPDIMEHRWFRKGFKKVRFYVEDDQVCSLKDGERELKVDDIESFSDQSMSMSMSESESESGEGSRRRLSVSHRPVSLNAFDLISFSPGFVLSGLFEEGNQGSRFMTSAPVKLEEIAQLVSFTVRKKDCRVCLEGYMEGAEIFELTPSLVVVEILKKGGDKAEFNEFFTRELKPGLDRLILEISPGSTPSPTNMAEEGHNPRG